MTAEQRARRDALAQERLMLAAGVLAGRFGVRPPAELVTFRGPPEVRAMKQREELAKFLVGLVVATAAKVEPEADKEPEMELELKMELEPEPGPEVEPVPDPGLEVEPGPGGGGISGVGTDKGG